MSYRIYHKDGALLCEKCHIIIKHNVTFEEARQVKRPHLCKECLNNEKEK